MMKKAKVIGYLEGTDALFLTNLVAKGYGTFRWEMA
jgi:hypothetical protein